MNLSPSRQSSAGPRLFFRPCLQVLGGLLVALPTVNLEAAPGHPHVLVILTDDQGWGDLSLHGNPNLRTPRLDGLAAEGVQFRHFFVQPVCSPTRAEFLTGRHAARGGVYGTSAGGERLDAGEQTIAEVFRAAGYRTGCFGKWHNGSQHPYHPNSRGFDEFYGFTSGHWGHYFAPPLDHNGALVQGEGYLADDLTNHAIAFLEQTVAAGGGPAFAHLALNTPHSPMQVPDAYWQRFADHSLDGRATAAELEDPLHTRAALAMVANIDDNVGRLLDALERLQIAGNTIVVFFSDNGPNGHRWNGGLRGIKASTDEGGVRSPCFLRWPAGVRGGRQIGEIAGAIDLLPTLASLAGIPLASPRPLDGLSLAPLLREEACAWPERVLFSHWRDSVSVRTTRWRLDAQGRLYDVQKDPGQNRDLAEREPAVTAYLRGAVATWRADVLADAFVRNRPFTVGHPAAPDTQLPARDATAEGGIERSNQYPNDSYFRRWTSTADAIVWPVEVLRAGAFAVEIAYTCPAADVGARFRLRFGEATLEGRITEAHDPPLRGAEADRVPRVESYVKDFRRLQVGTIELPAATGQLRLEAIEIPGGQVMDFRLLVLRRLGGPSVR